MMKRMLKGLLTGFLILVAIGMVPTGQAMAADLAFPILFVPIFSQNEPVAGAFTDTRIIVFNPSKHCPVALDPDCIGIAAVAGAGTELRIFFFDEDEHFVLEASRPMTPFDVEVITGPTIPSIAGALTGTAVLVNTYSGIGIAILAINHPLAAVVEIGAKTVAGSIPDPVTGPGGPAATTLFAVVATEAQLIPAFSGEFPRVEISAGAGGAGIPFGPDFETVIVETCVLSGFIDNFIVNDAEKLLGNTLIPCTGFDSALSAPDLLVWTPDDGGLLGTPAGALPLATLSAGYNRLAIDADSFTSTAIFYGQAIVIMPGGVTRQAYSYNMPANYFQSSLQAPTDLLDEIFLNALGRASEVFEATCEFLINHGVSCHQNPENNPS